MPAEKFDAYGEVLPDGSRGRREAPRGASGLLNRAGQAVFWLLVIVIVSARIIWYPASPAFQVGGADLPTHTAAR